MERLSRARYVQYHRNVGWPKGRETQGHGAAVVVGGRESRLQGTLSPMAQGSRLPCKEGVRVGVIPIAFTSLSMGTGEPDTSKVVCPVRGGTGRKGSNDLARGLPYLVPRSGFRRQVSASVRQPKKAQVAS